MYIKRREKRERRKIRDAALKTRFVPSMKIKTYNTQHREEEEEEKKTIVEEHSWLWRNLAKSCNKRREVEFVSWEKKYTESFFGFAVFVCPCVCVCMSPTLSTSLPRKRKYKTKRLKDERESPDPKENKQQKKMVMYSKVRNDGRNINNNKELGRERATERKR